MISVLHKTDYGRLQVALAATQLVTVPRSSRHQDGQPNRLCWRARRAHLNRLSGIPFWRYPILFNLLKRLVPGLRQESPGKNRLQQRDDGEKAKGERLAHHVECDGEI